MASGFLWHERYMWHSTGIAAGQLPAGGFVEPDNHVESVPSKRRFRNLVEVSGLIDHLTPLRPRMATEDELLRFHTPDYMRRVKQMSDAGFGDGGELAPIGPDSYDIARLSAGGCIVGLDAVVDGQVRNAYILNRPPGHHAEADRGRGFCLFGNVVIAVMHGRAERGLSRVATFDWDVHHGNGTQKAFYDRSDVLTVSVHQDNYYPQDSGGIEERGTGAGQGYNINVPLPAGSGHGAYVETVKRVVAPAFRAFRPDLIVVPSGFDANAMDPLGRQMCISDTYREMTSLLMELADELCDGRLLMCHEGGYSPVYVPWCGLATLEALSGQRTDAEDPYLPDFLATLAGQDVQPWQLSVIDAAASYVADIR
ncbi:MAG: class II histone deacetylase [Kiloniellales bacterium]